jgi:hypothetical protein
MMIKQIYFNLLATALEERDVLDKLRKIYNVDESGFPLKSRTPKIVSAEGKREAVLLTNVDRDKKVTIFDCFKAFGTYGPLTISFKGSGKVYTFKMDNHREALLE